MYKRIDNFQDKLNFVKFLIVEEIFHFIVFPFLKIRWVKKEVSQKLIQK